MGKQLFSGLTVLILLFFAVSLTVGSVSAAPNSTNSTVLSDPASDPVTTGSTTSDPVTTGSTTSDPVTIGSTTSDPSINSASASDLIKYLTPKDPSTGYIAIIDIERIEVSLEHIVLAYIPTSDLKDGKIPDSYLAYFSDASGDSNPIDLSSLGISTTDPTGDLTISPTAGDPVISNPVTSDPSGPKISDPSSSVVSDPSSPVISDPVASDPTNTGSSNTGNSEKESGKSSTCKPTNNKSSTSSKPTINSKTPTCKPATSTKPATSASIPSYIHK